jgi:hypothetical protein
MKFRAANTIGLGFCLFFAGEIYLARDWLFQAKLFPWTIGIPGLILSIVQVWRDWTGWVPKYAGGAQVDEVYERTVPHKTEILRILTFFSWMIGTGLAIWLLGFSIAISAFFFLYTKVEAREGWVLSLGMTAGAWLFSWGLFETYLGLQWPPGVLFD